MVGIRSIEVLNILQLNYDKFFKLSEVIKCNGYYVFIVDLMDSNILIYGRMFVFVIGIIEDFVIGNVNGFLGVYFVYYNFIKYNNFLLKFKVM